MKIVSKYLSNNIYEYNECFDEVIFNSKSVHQSIYVDEDTVWMSFFLGETSTQQQQQNKSSK